MTHFIEMKIIYVISLIFLGNHLCMHANESGIYESNSKELVISISDLTAEFYNKSQMQELLVLDKDLVCVLLNKCKENKLKFNGCLNMILIVALIQTFDAINLDKIEKIIYYNSISLRNFLGINEKKRYETLGYLSNSLYKELEITDSTENIIKNFWTLALNESNCLHARFGNNEHFIRTGMPKTDENQLNCHYFLSNLGVKRAHWQSDSTQKCIEIEEHYKYGNIFHQAYKGIFFASMTFIHNKMYLSLLFNNNVVDVSFVKFFRKFVLETLQLVANSV
jgi:hypothetical protein